MLIGTSVMLDHSIFYFIYNVHSAFMCFRDFVDSQRNLHFKITMQQYCYLENKIK